MMAEQDALSALRMFVAGVCQRRSCAAPFIIVVERNHDFTECPLGYCSPRCRRSAGRKRSYRRAAPPCVVSRCENKASRRWRAPLCEECMEIAAGSCRGKRRETQQEAARACVRLRGQDRSVRGERLRVYPCRICGHWHVGGLPGAPRRARLDSAVAALVTHLDPGELEELARSWAPANWTPITTA